MLADKVMRLVEGMTLFIGICTRKERVIASSALRSTWLPRGHLRARGEDCHWKTSDWIIQEIGLAKGRNLDLIILVEEGLRLPGGLQGDIEYIPFTRDAPEKCYGKILEMITALSPGVDALATGTTPATLTVREAAPLEKAPEGDLWTTPKPEWTRRQYEFAYMHLTGLENRDAASAISNAYLATESGGLSRESWEAYCEYTRIWLGKGGDLARIKRLADQHPKNSDVLAYLARGHAEYKQDDIAASIMERAAHETTNSPKKLARLREAAVAYQKAGNEFAASAAVEQIRCLVLATGEGEQELLSAEQRLAEARKNDEILVCVLERLMQINPSDNDNRFALAYKYSQMGHDDLALLHYESIPYGDRSTVTWNNLGVAYDQLGLPVQSVAAYRHAESAGETLAMSNLANKLLGAGSVCANVM